MHRIGVLFVVPVIVFAAACGSSSDEPANSNAPDATLEQPSTSSDGDADDVGPNNTDGSDGDPPASSSDAPAPLTGDLLSSFNPLEVLGGASQAGASASDVDPSLKDALLRAGDLPAGYTSMGDFTYSMNTELGNVELASSMFVSGDIESGAFDAMVMSAVVAMPPDVREEIEAQGGFDELSEITEADLQDMMDATGDLGFGISDVRLLDADGLGDGGVGMHMEMDFGGLTDAFGAPEDDVPFEALAFDMYMFLEGDRMLMTVVMWPGDGPSPLDSRELADIMDARAG